jgi:hypothetical protein
LLLLDEVVLEAFDGEEATVVVVIVGKEDVLAIFDLELD